MILTKYQGDPVRQFTGYEEFVKTGLEPCVTPDKERESRTCPKHFAGETWAYVKATAPGGDIEKAKKYRSGVIRQANKVMSEVSRLDPVYREEGGVWIDVSRFLSGEPEVWGDMVEMGHTRQARAVSLVLVCGAIGLVEASDYQATAEMIAGTIVGLKASGVQVRLAIAYETCGSTLGERDTMTFPLETANGFDVAKLAAVLTPWFHRRVKFGVIEAEGKRHYTDMGRSQFEMNETKARKVTGLKTARVIVLQSLLGKSQEVIKRLIIPGEVLR